MQRWAQNKTEAKRTNERTERMKRGKKNEMKWPNMYNKQWKIHNEFEKDECKWSEVDFYQEFMLCIYMQRAMLWLCIQISAHVYERHQMHVRGRKTMAKQKKNHHQHQQQQQQQTESKTWKKITIRTKRSKQSTKCAILSGIWVFENDMFVHIAYTLHAFSFDTSLCAYKQEWQLIYNASKPNYALFRTKVLMGIAKNQNIINGEWAAESGWRRKRKKNTRGWTISIEFERIPNEPAQSQLTQLLAFDTEFQISRCIILYTENNRSWDIFLDGKIINISCYFFWFCILLYRICFV